MSRRTPDTCFECLRSRIFPYLEWNWNRRDQDFAVDHRSTAQKLAEPGSMLADTLKAKMLRHGMQENLMTYFLSSKKVGARDLFGERLKKFGIREEIARDSDESRCLTDGSNFLAVFLTEDGFVDFLEAYGVDAPRKILNAISETFGTEIFSELPQNRNRPVRRRRPRRY